MSDLIKPEQRGEQRERGSTDGAEVGQWYWTTIKSREEDEPATRVLMCVTHIGSNYVKLEGPAILNKYSNRDDDLRSVRVHFDGFWDVCEHVPDPDPIIDGEIEKHQAKSRALMNEVKRLTALLGVAPRQQLSQTSTDEVAALSIRTGEPTKQYKAALMKAKEETLPDLFEKIKESNKALGQWMKVKLIPMKAEAEKLTGTVGLVEDRIFSVELYAGLVEEVQLVRDGDVAKNDECVHLMQRRHYMDEECLVGYEHGGMDYKGIDDFDRWLSKEKNFNRIFPFPRTLVAFRVRRHKKERQTTLTNFIRVMNEQKWDETTFLYIRNGERLYRLQTEVDFEEKLFPDTNHKIFTASKLWSRSSRPSIEEIITDEQYQGMVEDCEREDAEIAAEEPELEKKYPEDKRWMHRRHKHHHDPRERYHPFTPENVYYDDIAGTIEQERKKHNRIVLIVQGLLDRSPVLQPHPPWQLWTNDGFAAAFRLHYDDSRALSAGEKPDFEAYRAKLNSYLTTGSITIGQERPWLMREAVKENERRNSNASWNSSDWREVETFRPSGDPGPGKLARVDRYDEKSGACTYFWKRQKRNAQGWGIRGTEVEARLVTGDENVLNVDAYRPGDFHIFFDDPRTRQEYLRWAPILLEAEECHAGNREGFRPARALLAPRPVTKREERPLDLAVPKPRPPRETLAEKWKGKNVVLLHSFESKGGAKFKMGETLLVTNYYRAHVDLRDPGVEGRSIYKVPVSWVEMVEEPASNEKRGGHHA